MLQDPAWNSHRSSTHPDRPHRQRWSHLSPTRTFPVVATAAGPSYEAGSHRLESALDESARTYRTTALRQLNGNSKPRMRGQQQQQEHSGGQSSSTSIPQPVLVRTYSGDANEDRSTTTETTKKKPSTTNRFLSFIGLASTSPSSGAQERAPELPSSEEFSIGGILQAIDPNIQGTLDSIAEIYGRSKLSLANEYGSHIAPLGEIRASPGYYHLLTVDEASSEQERQQQDDDHHHDAGGNQEVDIYGNDGDDIQQVSGMVALSGGGDRSSVQAEPDTPLSTTETNPGFDSVIPEFVLVPVTREFSSRPKSSGKAFLAKNDPSTSTESRQGIFTPAVVSEVHLDAQADSLQQEPETTHATSNSKHNVLTPLSGFLFTGLPSVLSRFSRTARGRPNICKPQPPAEVQLRAMLDGNHGR